MSDETKTVPAIGLCLVDVMRRVGAIRKEQENKFDRYKFRGIDDVFNALQPALIDAGVVVVPQLVSHVTEPLMTAKGDAYRLAIVAVKYSFLAATDGSSVEATVIGEGSDRGDKAFNKAMSSAYKNVMFQTFCIPVEDGAADSETESPEFVAAKAAPAKAAAKPAPKKAALPSAMPPSPNVREFMFARGTEAPESPKWRKWRDDEIKSGKMAGKTWGDIAEGQYAGQRYQWARSIMTFSEASPETQLRGANCVFEIEQRHYGENDDATPPELDALGEPIDDDDLPF